MSIPGLDISKIPMTGIPLAYKGLKGRQARMNRPFGNHDDSWLTRLSHDGFNMCRSVLKGHVALADCCWKVR